LSNNKFEKDVEDVEKGDKDEEEDAISDEDSSQGKQSSSQGRFKYGGGAELSFKPIQAHLEGNSTASRKQG
jgi:hypothetical protein